MKTYNYADASLNFPLIFETALNEDVILKKNDGNQFIIVSCSKKKSPFDNIRGMNMSVSNEEIVNIVKETRARRK